MQRLGAGLRVGGTLPFDVRDAGGGLLLPQGSAVADEAMRQALLARSDAGIEPAQFHALQQRLAARRQDAEQHFMQRWAALPAAPAEAAAPLLALADLCPDRLLFALLRGEIVGGKALAGLAALLSRRAGWAAPRRLALLRDALSPAESAGQGDDEAAALLQVAGLYLSRLDGVSPRQAARDLFMACARHPFAALLVKELGPFPPGSLVRLPSGETAVVLRRGPRADAPQLATVAEADGQALDAARLYAAAAAG